MDLIPRARLTTQFLESNASTHESVFGAIAEIVDNAYDSGSKKLEIDIAKPENDACGEFYILLRDYGCGMSAEDIFNVIAYGWSNKCDNPTMIGMYGNGLKSGSMRVANDCLILTKKNDECSALMISRTFIENPDNKDNEVICPCPSWRIVTDSSTGKTDKVPMHVADPKKTLDEVEKEMERHDMEVDLLTKYSPFSNEEDLLSEFDSLEGSGTCIYLYNLSLNETGKTELSIDHDENNDDILDVGNNDDHDPKSLKKFLCDLYLKPKMEIYLRQTFIRPVRLQDLMYDRRKYNLPQQKFRSIAKTKIAEFKDKKKKMEQKLRKAKGAVAEIRRKMSDKISSDGLKDTRQKNMHVEKITAEIAQMDNQIKNKERISEVNEFAMYLGYNIRERKACGLRLFNKNRLIVEIDGNQWASWPLGVLACVDIPASLMQPSMSKQRFSDEREFKILQKICLERAKDYAKRCYMEFDKWVKFGYVSSNNDIDPVLSTEVEIALNRALPKVFRCTECGKFRAIESYEALESIDPAFFSCQDNPIQKYSGCEKEEQRIFSKEVELLPVVKNEKPDSDVEEVSVSPERKKARKMAQNGGKKGFTTRIDVSRMEIDSANDQMTSDDEIKIHRRLRRKRKSGQRRPGAEVTSGFDRFRASSASELSDGSQDTEDEKEALPLKTESRKTISDTEKQMLKIQKEKDELEERNRILIDEMRSCVKHFYPTSWKLSDRYSHREIENWDHETISRNSKSWKESYTKDLKSIVSTCEKKKALKAKIELADHLLGGKLTDPDDMMKRIKKVKQEALSELKKLKENK